MAIWQDSSHPSGVSGDQGHTGPGNNLAHARTRKADAAVQLRLAGASWEEIARTLGYPTPRHALVATERALQKQLLTTDRDMLRQMAGARLERLLRSVWPKAVNPDDPEHLFAVARAREIIDRHAKLFGLDAPAEMIIHSPTRAELDAWVGLVLTTSGPPVEEFDIIEGEVSGDTTESA